MKRIVGITFGIGIAAAFCAGLAACGSTTSQDFVDASPSFETLSMDIAASDGTAPTGVASSTAELQAAPADPSVVALTCHPHLFVRTHEVVARVNRHLFRIIGRLDFIANRKPTSSTDTTRVWEHLRLDGNTVRYTITRTGEVFTWTFELKGSTGDFVTVATGHVDRTNATAPGEGVGSVSLDLTALASVTGEHVSGTLTADFDRNATSRKLTVVATDVVWNVDPTLLPDTATGLAAALETPRNDRYVYYREPGKGGSLKIMDQMVFLCPANPSFLLADVELVHRWYDVSGTRHGRSDALMAGGQLTGTSIDRIVGVTCFSGSTTTDPAEGYWLMKAEDVDGATVVGGSHDSSTAIPPVEASACDSAFGSVPALDTNATDFDFTAIDFTDDSVVTFPTMQ